MTSDAARLTPIGRSGTWRGLGGLTLAEIRRWLPWRTLVLLLAGVGVFAAIFAIWWVAGANTQANLRLGSLMYTFFSFWAIILTLLVAATAQGAVAGEIEDGTASWLVGMPVGRPTFIASKVLGAAAGLLIAVFGTGMVVYPMLSFASGIRIEEFNALQLLEVIDSAVASEGFARMPDAAEYLGILLRLSIFMVVLVALMVLLGSLIRSQAMVLGVGVVLAVGLFLLGLGASGTIVETTPAGLISGLLAAVQAEPAPLAGPLIASVLWVAAITGLAVLGFGRREL